jgi:uncharacterized protein YecE (DUF72 family)
MLLDDEQERPAAGGQRRRRRLGSRAEDALGGILAQRRGRGGGGFVAALALGRSVDQDDFSGEAGRMSPLAGSGAMMQMLAGTSGYSYKEWLGHFYPEKLPADEMLHYYSRKLPTVEINNTFYRMPAETLLERWAGEVPENFTFTLKAPRRITHLKQLKEVQSDVSEFVRRAGVLGDKLGVLLFQLPPFLRKDVPRLRDFLAALPEGRRAAVEFRHASWQDEEVYETLRARSAILCIADTDEATTPWVCTSDWAYLRLRRVQYEESDLRAWIERLGGQKLERAFVYFKHEDEGFAARFATQLLDLWRGAHGPA